MIPLLLVTAPLNAPPMPSEPAPPWIIPLAAVMGALINCVWPLAVVIVPVPDKVRPLGTPIVNEVLVGLKSSTERLIGTSSEMLCDPVSPPPNTAVPPPFGKVAGVQLVFVLQLPSPLKVHVAVFCAWSYRVQPNESRANATRDFRLFPVKRNDRAPACLIILPPHPLLHGARASKSDLMTHRLPSRDHRFEESVLAARLRRWVGNIATGNHMDITK